MPDTMPEMNGDGEEIVDAGVATEEDGEGTEDDWFTGFCAMETAEVFACYLEQCNEDLCEDELGDSTFLDGLPWDGIDLLIHHNSPSC